MLSWDGMFVRGGGLIEVIESVDMQEIKGCGD